MVRNGNNSEKKGEGPPALPWKVENPPASGVLSQLRKSGPEMVNTAWPMEPHFSSWI